jgi:Flp pilus assembly protein CpaB
MRAKTVLTILFALSLVVAAFVVLRAIPQKPEQAAAVTSQILVALIRLDPGTLLRDQDVTWGTVNRRSAPGEFSKAAPDVASVRG